MRGSQGWAAVIQDLTVCVCVCVCVRHYYCSAVRPHQFLREKTTSEGIWNQGQIRGHIRTGSGADSGFIRTGSGADSGYIRTRLLTDRGQIRTGSESNRFHTHMLSLSSPNVHGSVSLSTIKIQTFFISKIKKGVAGPEQDQNRPEPGQIHAESW